MGVVLTIRDYSKGGNADVIDMPDAPSHFFESIVRVIVLFLGVHGFRRALRRRHQLQERISLSSKNYEDEEVGDVPMEFHPSGLLGDGLVDGSTVVSVEMVTIH